MASFHENPILPWRFVTHWDDGKPCCASVMTVGSKSTLRVVALGRKNFLFAGSDGGGSAAAIYSLVGSAKLNGINPESYLRDVLSRISDNQIKRIEEFLPWNVAASLKLPIRQAA